MKYTILDNKYFKTIQVAVAFVSTEFRIEGALLVGFDNSTGKNEWQWTLTNPTALRSDPIYSKVL